MTNSDQREELVTMCVSKSAIENSEIGYCCHFEAEPEHPVCLSFAAITEEETCSPNPNSRQTGATTTGTATCFNSYIVISNRVAAVRIPIFLIFSYYEGRMMVGFRRSS